VEFLFYRSERKSRNHEKMVALAASSLWKNLVGQDEQTIRFVLSLLVVLENRYLKVACRDGP
jgi:hypothetical protein